MFKDKPTTFLQFMLHVAESALAMAFSQFLAARMEDLFCHITGKEKEEEKDD